MSTTIFVFQIIFLVIASLISLIYILFQMYQKLPAVAFKISTADYVIFSVVSLIFGFGTNSYYGLGAFVPLLAIKFIFKKMLVPQRLRGSGRWIEVDWRRLSLRGFEKNIPKNVLAEMNKIPKDAHFIIPRLFANIFIRLIMKRMNKEMGKGMPAGAAAISKNQQQMAMGQFASITESILKLEKGKTERKDFPFGVLKVTRL